METTNNKYHQWYIITAIGGKEDKVVKDLEEKIHNFKYTEWVSEIKVIKDKITTVTEFKKNDEALPKKFNNTKTTTWSVLPNGSYKKTVAKEVNRFPGYVFIKMDVTDTVWYAVRNTPNVLGFLGSTGNNAKPIPISNDEFYEMISSKKTEESPIVIEKEETVVEKKKTETFSCDFKVGDNVVFADGSSDEQCEVKEINLQKGTAIIIQDFFGRTIDSEVSINIVKKA